MRELEQWMPEDSGQDELQLDVSGGANGWSAHDMFAKNEEFGVKTSFDPNMSSYTVQLKKDREDSAEWREKERKAAKIAAEIEGNSSSVAAIELENGDEEEAFSAVVRGDKGGSPGQEDKPYVPPGRRDQGQGRGGRGGGRSWSENHSSRGGLQREQVREELQRGQRGLQQREGEVRQRIQQRLQGGQGRQVQQAGQSQGQQQADGEGRLQEGGQEG